MNQDHWGKQELFGQRLGLKKFIASSFIFTFFSYFLPSSLQASPSPQKERKIFFLKAQTSSRKKTLKLQKPKPPSGSQSFDELLVEGEHYFSDEQIVTVEKDKVLDELLKIPKNFKNRILKSANRH